MPPTASMGMARKSSTAESAKIRDGGGVTPPGDPNTEPRALGLSPLPTSLCSGPRFHSTLQGSRDRQGSLTCSCKGTLLPIKDDPWSMAGCMSREAGHDPLPASFTKSRNLSFILTLQGRGAWAEPTHPPTALSWILNDCRLI